MPGQHPPSCAKRWRERAEAQRWPMERLVEEIHRCCAVSRLRAHRLALGWTLREATAQFHATRSPQDQGWPNLDEDQLGVWETNARRRPKTTTVDLLCRLYRTDAQGLGLAGDYRGGVRAELPAPAEQPAIIPDPGPGNASFSFERLADQASAGSGLESYFDRCVESVRQRVDRTLASATVNTSQLDVLDERLHLYRLQYVATPPRPMMELLLADLVEIQALAADRQPAAVQARLSEITALLATLVADAQMKLGSLRQSRAWFGTARMAADDSGNPELRARVRAQAAMLPYYYGPLDAAVTLAREARLLTRGRPSPTAALACAAEARAIARQRGVSAAEAALRQARQVFEQTDAPEHADDVFAFSERRFLLYLSGSHTFLGQTKPAREAQQRALGLYPGQTGIDPALLRLEAAICLAHEHCLNDACALASETYLAVPEEPGPPSCAPERNT